VDVLEVPSDFAIFTCQIFLQQTVTALGREPSCHDLLNHFATYIGQAEVSACVAEGQPLVIQTHEGQQRGVQIARREPALASSRWRPSWAARTA